jgi:Protein of unknown function (DUF2794)
MNLEAPTPFPVGQRMSEDVCFDRKELGLILRLYGQMVAAGEWRDYGISTLRDLAVFSVFRRTAENPLYRIEKRPKLRRGHDLASVLRVLERKLIRPVD